MLPVEEKQRIAPSLDGDTLRQEYTIDTPENVSVAFDVAGIGSRFIGALIDTLAIGVLLVVLNIVLIFVLQLVGGYEVLFFGLEQEIPWAAGLALALYALFQFAIFWGYYFFFELMWNGQSPGKRVARVRVVQMDGNPAGFAEVAIRNLVRIVDFLPTFYAVGLVTMFFNEKSRRLGDFAAGTMVVREQPAVGLAALEPYTPAPARPAADGAPPLLPDADLRRLTHADILLVRDALARDADNRLPHSTLRRLATLMATKVGLPTPSEPRRFLTDLAAAYDQRGR